MVLVASSLGGCGGGSTPSPAAPARRPLLRSDATCRQDARLVADAGRQFLRHYASQAPGPADVAYFSLQDVLADFQSHRCRPQILGTALVRRLTPSQQTALFSHLPDVMVRYLEWARACGRRRAVTACTHLPASVKTMRASNPSGNRHPLTP
jgi:hypothetical protein